MVAAGPAQSHAAELRPANIASTLAQTMKAPPSIFTPCVMLAAPASHELVVATNLGQHQHRSTLAGRCAAPYCKARLPISTATVNRPITSHGLRRGLPMIAMPAITIGAMTTAPMNMPNARASCGVAACLRSTLLRPKKKAGRDGQRASTMKRSGIRSGVAQHQHRAPARVPCDQRRSVMARPAASGQAHHPHRHQIEQQQRRTTSPVASAVLKQALVMPAANTIQPSAPRCNHSARAQRRRAASTASNAGTEQTSRPQRCDAVCFGHFSGYRENPTRWRW